LVLGAILLVAAWWIFAPMRARRLLLYAPILLVSLAGLQFLLEGFYWQFLPAYAAIVILALLSLFSRKPPQGFLALFGRIALGGMALFSLAPFMLLLPVPVLPKPSGPYAVGTQVMRWIDENRAEPNTPLLDDKRNVIAQAWYPAAERVLGNRPRPIYIDGLKALPEQVSLFPGFMLKSFGRIETHADLDAPVAADKPVWPVVIFSPGYGGMRAVYTGLATDLASRGYVVIALDHPYESAVTELADGAIAAGIDNFPASGSQAERDAYMAARLNTRVADIRFTIDQLARPKTIGVLANHIDPEHIAVIGHSFGGAASVASAQRDPRVKAAANVDGTLYDGIWDKSLSQPFLLLDSDHVETGHSDKNKTDNKTLLANLSGTGWTFEIHRANHYSFTDAPLFFAPPGRFALSLLIGGGRGPEETQRAAADILDAFLSAKDVPAAAASYKDITGGQAH
jgi:predicted dienelactone hydrolase